VRNPGYVECPGSLPDAEGIAIVASTEEAKFSIREVERMPDGVSWRSLVLERVGSPGETIEIRIVREKPVIVETRYLTEAECGPIEFHLAMESHGRTLDGIA